MEIRRPNAEPNKQPRVKLVRGADGRLRSASDDTDIGDIWAEQRRIRLAEAIEEDKKKAARKRLRQQHGLFGLAKSELSNVSSKAKVQLFGEQPKKLESKPAQKDTPKPKTEMAKTVEIKLVMPKLPRLNPVPYIVSVVPKLHTSKKVLGFAGAIAVVVVMVLVGWHFWPTHSKNQLANSASNAHQSPTLTYGTPNYSTVLPAGKTIQQLGGWARISPPDKNPVYAYADKVGGIDVSVSEQPLPPNFQQDTDNQINQLAQASNAKLKLYANGTTVYIGTSAQGPQSVFFTKDNLLLLIRSTSPIPSGQWIAYINSLQ